MRANTNVRKLKNVEDFEIGDRVAADNSELCQECFYCRRGQALLCEKVRRFARP